MPEQINDLLRKIAKKEKMSFNNVIVSCIQNSLNEMDLSKYKDVNLYNEDNFNNNNDDDEKLKKLNI